MNAARTLLNNGQIRLHSDVQLRMWPAAAHLEHMYLRRGIVWVWTISHLAHVEDAREKDVCRIECRHADYNGAQSSNLPFLRHRAAVPWRRRIPLSTIVDQREALVLGVFKEESGSAIPLEDFTVLHALFVETACPPR